MPLYNLTGIADNTTTVVGFVQNINTNLVYNQLGVFILLSIAAIVFMSSFRNTGDYKDAAITAGTSCLVISLFLRMLFLISNHILVTVLILTAMAIGSKYMSSR